MLICLAILPNQSQWNSFGWTGWVCPIRFCSLLMFYNNHSVKWLDISTSIFSKTEYSLYSYPISSWEKRNGIQKNIYLVKSFWNKDTTRKEILKWKCLFCSKEEKWTRYPNQDYQTEEVWLYSQRYEDRVFQS